MLVELYVAITHRGCILRCDGRHLLPSLTLEALLDEPLTYELLRELSLRLTLSLTLLVTIEVEVARGVRRVDLVDQDHLAILLTKLILRVHEDQSTLTSDACPLLKECLRVLLDHLVVLLRNQSRGDDLLTTNILVVALISLGRWGDDRVWETLILLQPLG